MRALGRRGSCQSDPNGRPDLSGAGSRSYASQYPRSDIN